MPREEDDECIHGLGMKSACVLCNGRAAREDVRTIRYSFSARFAALLDCGHFSTPGEEIHRLDDESLVCEECRP